MFVNFYNVSLFQLFTIEGGRNISFVPEASIVFDDLLAGYTYTFYVSSNISTNVLLLGRVAQSVTCLATDACLTADPGVASSIPARYHTFVEIDHEIISTVILLLPLIYSRRVVVSYKRKYVHKLLVNRLLKPAQEKLWLSELTVPQ